MPKGMRARPEEMLNRMLVKIKRKEITPRGGTRPLGVALSLLKGWLRLASGQKPDNLQRKPGAELCGVSTT